MLRKILLFLLFIAGLLTALGHAVSSVFNALSAATFIMTILFGFDFPLFMGVAAFFFIFFIVSVLDIAQLVLIWSGIIMTGKELWRRVRN